MTTYYVDLEGAAGTGDGSSFANRAGSLSGVVGITSGDEVRVKATAPATLLGNATWVGGKRDSVNKAISTASNTSPIVITTTADHGLIPGDYVVIFSVATNTYANGTWKVGATPTTTSFEILQMDGSNTVANGAGTGGSFNKFNNNIVKLASPVTKNIALYGGLGQKPVWTPSSNVTATANTSAFKEGFSSASIAINATFTTGKAAYTSLPATLDLSAYQQVSFWLMQAAGTLGSAGQIYLALCSDTAGNVVVDRLDVPPLGATSQWNCITVDKGANLGSNINSVALYVVTDLGAQTFLIDNIVACKASSSDDSLTMNSLISKGASLGEWFAIQSINYDAVQIANLNSASANATRGYYGTSETVATYKRQPLRPSAAFTIPVSGSNSGVGSITYSGGWDRTDMSTQTDYTWLDGISARTSVYGVNGLGQYFYNIERICGARWSAGIYSPGRSVKLADVAYTACGTGIASGEGFVTTGAIYINNNGTPVSLSSTGGTRFGAIKSIASSSQGISIGTINDNYFQSIERACNLAAVPVTITTGSNNWIGRLEAADNNASYALTATTGINNVVGGGSSSGHTAGGFSLTTGTLFVNNFTVNESVDVVISGTGIGTAYFNRLDNTDKNSVIYNWSNLGTIIQQTSVVDSPATSAWRLAPGGSTSQGLPLKLKLGTIVVAAGSLVTVTARMRRDDPFITLQLVCPVGQVEGMTSDAVSSVTINSNWQTLTITFTPTNVGAVDIYAYAYGSGYGYVCNLTASQA